MSTFLKFHRRVPRCGVLWPPCSSSLLVGITHTDYNNQKRVFLEKMFMNTQRVHNTYTHTHTHVHTYPHTYTHTVHAHTVTNTTAAFIKTHLLQSCKVCYIYICMITALINHMLIFKNAYNILESS